ncbi:MAG: DUF2130 domain-containing protein, partial [candidate division WOR-3 bacterium]
IIYECKRSPKILTQHVTQAANAKRSQQADFAVLVTTGQRRGFSGFAQLSGVLIVSPLGSIQLAYLLRTHLIEMLRADITREQRALIATRLMTYITGPQFRNPIEGVISKAMELEQMLKAEAQDHFRYWRRRWESYRAINWNTEQIRTNIQLVLHGKEPRPLSKPKPERLALPAPR